MTSEYTWEEIAKHNDASSLWIVFDNRVYDVTKFLEEHPGGEDILLQNAAKDATSNFEAIGHSADARELRKKYQIGIVAKKRAPKPAFPMALLLGTAVVAIGIGIIIAYKLYKK